LSTAKINPEQANIKQFFLFLGGKKTNRQDQVYLECIQSIGSNIKVWQFNVLEKQLEAT